jgi:drug/metabolite transporter (DMT)-like permease
MNPVSAILILISLVTFVAGQLLLKRAMTLSSRSSEPKRRRMILLLLAGIASMTISFFLTIGLLQRFDLSYLYPFQGLSVIIISVCAAIVLHEKLTLQLTIGALLISAGIILVSLT